MAKSSSMPQFTYPAPQAGGYIYNEGDSINVTWTWNEPPVNATTGLILWVDDTAMPIMNKTFLSTSGYSVLTLDYNNPTVVQYPTKGHFMLVANFGNGTQTWGQNSEMFTWRDPDGLAPVCQNCATLTNLTTSMTAVGQSPSSALSTGVIAGIVVSSVVALLAIAALLYICLRRRKARHGHEELMTKTTASNGISTQADDVKANASTSANKPGHVLEMDSLSPNAELAAPVFFEIGNGR